MIDDKGVLGFNCHLSKKTWNGVDYFVRIYACRGIGTKYDEFYKWLNTVKHVTTSCDWPWHYFYFEDMREEQIFLSKYASKFIYFDAREDE